VAERRFGDRKLSLVSLMIKAGICPSVIPYSFLKKYCEKDVELTRQVFLQQRKELNEKNLLPVMYTRCITTPVLADIERKGMHLDKARVTEEHIKYERLHSSISQQISKFTGGINLNSPKQVAELLYERLGFSECTDRRGNTLRTGKGGRKTDAATITALKANNKPQREFLRLFAEYGKVDAALSKNLRFFQAVVDETADSVFYANLNQTVTKTHRLSSTGKPVEFVAFNGKRKGIQLQNIPRQFKTLFTAREMGWVIGEIDGAQLEFRVAAFLGQDRNAINDIENGADVHQATADTITAGGQRTDRQGAKSHTFKPLYGGTSGTKAERRYYEYFKKRYAGVTAEQERWKDEVERTKQLTTATGLIFYWPDTEWEGSARNPYLKNTTSICNFPVQSLATADIIPIAITIMWYLIRENKLLSYIINTIHDSSILEIHPDEEKLISTIGELSFNSGVKGYLEEVYKIDFNVPLEAEMKIGSCWNGD
jgi:DNA polymerase-1